MFPVPYATVIVGAMPVNATALVGTTLPLNTLGAAPTKNCAYHSVNCVR